MVNTNYGLKRNQRLSMQRNGLHLTNIGSFPSVDVKPTQGEMEKILLAESKINLPEYLTSVGRKAPIPSQFGLGYNVEK